MKEIEVIQQFENVFIEAGKLAVKLRNDAAVEQKHNSGIKDINIVASADLDVQEFVLGKLLVSNLKRFEVVAEERK